jgi:hypothetical protein
MLPPRVDHNTVRAFQNAVLRNVNDKNAQLQKQLDNVVREGPESLSPLCCAPR